MTIPVVKPAKVTPTVITAVLATIESLEGSPTEELITSVAGRVMVVKFLAGDVFGRAVEDVVVRVLTGDVSGRVIEDIVERPA